MIFRGLCTHDWSPGCVIFNPKRWQKCTFKSSKSLPNTLKTVSNAFIHHGTITNSKKKWSLLSPEIWYTANRPLFEAIIAHVIGYFSGCTPPLNADFDHFPPQQFWCLQLGISGIIWPIWYCKQIFFVIFFQQPRPWRLVWSDYPKPQILNLADLGLVG